MKTYEEALETVFVEVKDAAELQAVSARLISQLERSQSLALEIAHYPRTALLIEATMKAIPEKEEAKSVFGLGMTMFLAGIFVGIEMERQEIGDV